MIQLQKNQAAAAFVLLLFCAGMRLWAGPQFPPLGGDTGLAKAADSADIRARLWEPLLNEPISKALLQKERTEQNGWGIWKIKYTRVKDAFYTLIVPQRNGAWTDYTQGSWILKRSARDGSWIQAKVFLRSDPGTFIRLYPFGKRVQMEVVAYSGVLYREIILPLNFAQAVREPLSRLMALSVDIVDWTMFSPSPSLFAELRRFAEAVRNELPKLRYADDGAIDENGIPVFIASLKPQGDNPGLNCSGFLKWMVDGMIFPLSGSYLSVSKLKTRMLESRGSGFTESYEELLDPFFGLDWSRALAHAAWSVLYSDSGDSALAHDVNAPAFALIAGSADPVNGGSLYEAYSDNFTDVGISIRGLKSFLFMLASEEPGRMYFAQFNARAAQGSALRRYFHVAALLPYFDEQGIFRVTVFESAEETSLDRVMGDTNYEFVKLVRMPIMSKFQPPSLKKAN